MKGISRKTQTLKDFHARPIIESLLLEFDILSMSNLFFIILTIHFLKSHTLQSTKYNISSSDQLLNDHIDFEVTIKRISNTLQELGHLLNWLNATFNSHAIINGELSKLSLENLRLILTDAERLSDLDGYSSWRKQESKNLTRLVQTQIFNLQNPANCNLVKKAVCDLRNSNCGLGCMVHHVITCLIIAYGSKRTLILEPIGKNYNNGRWDEIFLPITKCHQAPHLDKRPCLPIQPNISEIYLPDFGLYWYCQKPEWMPRAIPANIASRLIRLHGNPLAWWVGQIAQYVFRFTPEMINLVILHSNSIQYQKPIIGIHVRRTDKIFEAGYQKLSEYMEAADDYVENIETNQVVGEKHAKRIYLASDDLSIKKVKSYKNFRILSSCEQIPPRYSIKDLKGIARDIFLLSISDFLVCTFSSNVCRLAYALMQTHAVDASRQIRSLDDQYIFYRGTSLYTKCRVSHQPGLISEIELQIGDEIHMHGNHWTGLSKGKNLRTNLTGLFPSFKVDEIFHTFNRTY